MMFWTRLLKRSHYGAGTRFRPSVERLGGRDIPSVTLADMPGQQPAQVADSTSTDDWEYDPVTGELRPSQGSADAAGTAPATNAGPASPSGNGNAGTVEPTGDDKKAEERNKRLEELSKDPDRNNGRPDATTRREAEVGLALEEAGKIPGPIRRPDAKQGEKRGLHRRHRSGVGSQGIQESGDAQQRDRTENRQTA